MGSKPRDRFYSNPGSNLAPVHAIRIDDLGHKTLVDTGERTDIYEKIKSHADEVDIVELLRRCDVEGYQVLDRAAVTEGDVTLVPKSMMEAQQMLQDQENKFNQLPIDIRKNFNFSFTEYIAEAGNNIESWSKKMGYEPITREIPVAPTETKEEGGNE